MRTNRAACRPRKNVGVCVSFLFESEFKNVFTGIYLFCEAVLDDLRFAGI